MSTEKRILRLESQSKSDEEGEVKCTIPVAKHEVFAKTDEKTVLGVLSWVAEQLARVSTETDFSSNPTESTIEIRFIDAAPGEYQGMTLDSQRRSLEQILGPDKSKR